MIDLSQMLWGSSVFGAIHAEACYASFPAHYCILYVCFPTLMPQNCALLCSELPCDSTILTFVCVLLHLFPGSMCRRSGPEHKHERQRYVSCSCIFLSFLHLPCLSRPAHVRIAHSRLHLFHKPANTCRVTLSPEWVETQAICCIKAPKQLGVCWSLASF